MHRSRSRRLAFRNLAGQLGYTLIETLVAMTLLAVVIGSLADGFVTSSKTEYDQTARADDQEAARQSLERMRRDIHCASSANAQQTLDALGNPTDGYTLTLTVNPNQCIAVTTSQSDGVQWCTVSVGGATNRYQLFRTISGQCNAASAVFQEDYITSPNVWAVTCSAAHLAGVSVDLAVNRDIATRPDRTYELKDTIALRNDTVASVPGC